MLRAGLLILTVATLFAAGVSGAAFGDVRRQTTVRRPDIVEVGQPFSISPATLHRETHKIRALSEYVHLYGLPDYAEVQEIEPEWPWESFEVRLYYMQRNLETDFGHVFVSSAMPNFGVLKFRGDIPPDKRHQIDVILAARHGQPPSPPAEAPVVAAAQQEDAGGIIGEALVARLEAAAERAAQAADRAAEQSEAAVRAADRTVRIVEKMEQSVTAAAPAPQ
ncbi:MAG: hypothetical protein ACE5I7_08925 [Candidatus Binatia bacterium]